MRSKYPDLATIMVEKILERVVSFKYGQIDKIIQEAIRKQMPKAEDCNLLFMSVYYTDTLSEILDYLVETTVLYRVGSVYTNNDYRINTNYEVEGMDLVYSPQIANEQSTSLLYSVETAQKIQNPTTKNIILTTKNANTEDDKNPEVSLNEIHLLYQNFINQGATKEQALLGILNYYNAKKLEESHPNSYVITPNPKTKTRKIA